jgi:hypothetical protein
VTRLDDATTDGLLADRVGFSMPPDGTLREYWAGVDFAPVRRRSPAVQGYLRQMRQLYCEIAFATFAVPSSPAIRWFLARGRPDEIKFFDRFWRTRSVRATLPGLETGPRFRNLVPFEWLSPFCLGGELAAAVYTGGCSSKYRGTPAEARQAGEEARHGLIGDRYNEVYVYHNHGPWCEALEFMVCRWTWVAVDLREALIHVLYAVDVD